MPLKSLPCVLVLCLSLQLGLSGCTVLLASWRDVSHISESPREETRLGPAHWSVSGHEIVSVDPPVLRLQLQAAHRQEIRQITDKKIYSQPHPWAMTLGVGLNLALLPLGVWLDQSVRPQIFEDPEFFTLTAVMVMLVDMTLAMMFLEDSDTQYEALASDWQPGDLKNAAPLSHPRVRVSAPNSPWAVNVPLEDNSLILNLQKMPSAVMGRDPLQLQLEGLAAEPVNLALDELTLISLRQAFRPYIAIEPARLNWSLRFSDASGDGRLEGEERAEVLLEIHNQGPGKAYQLDLHLAAQGAEAFIRFPERLALGNLEAGETRQWRIPLQAAHDPPAQTVDLSLKLHELNGFEPAPKHLLFQSAPFRRPDLYLADHVIEDQNGNGKVEPLEIATVTARLHNRGQGPAEQIQVRLELPEHLFLTAESPRSFEVASLPAGAYHDLSFSFYTNHRAPRELKIALSLQEKHGAYARSGEVPVSLYQTLRKPETILIPGQANENPLQTAAPDLGSEIADNLPLAAAPQPEAVAVIIGNRDYRNAPGVEYALRDAALMRRYLLQVLGYREENILYYPNATKADLDTLFGTREYPQGKIHNWLKKDAPVFLYYTGHGAPGLNGQRYLVPVDANLDYLPQTGYALETLYQNMSRAPYGELTVVIDACFSGLSPRGTLFPGRSPLVLEAAGPDPAPLGQALVINSSGQNQLSHWYDEKRHSLFTYYFLKGLQGAADLNGDRQLTDTELQQYLSQQVPYMARRLNGGEQQPVFWRQAPRVMARYAQD